MAESGLRCRYLGCEPHAGKASILQMRRSYFKHSSQLARARSGGEMDVKRKRYAATRNTNLNPGQGASTLSMHYI